MTTCIGILQFLWGCRGGDNSRKYRYLHEIQDLERKNYAQICNIHVRQGKVDANLRERTLNTFTSDSEKIEFLTKFEHRRELVDFYLARGRVKEAFIYLIKTEGVEKALEMIFDRTGTANMSEVDKELQLSEVFKYAQTRKLLSSISKHPLSGVDINHEERFSRSSCSDPWAKLATTANEYFKSGTKKPARANIQDTWIREYLDTIVNSSLKHYFYANTN